MPNYSNVVLNGFPHDDGAENPSGIQELAYLLLYRDILTLQEPVASTTEASLLTISTTHVMKTGKAPLTAEPVFEKSDFESMLEGEIYSKLFNPKLKFFLAQPVINAAGGFAAIKNARFIALFRRPGDTANFYQMGGKAMAAKIAEGGVKFGSGPTGEPGITFTLEAHSTMPFFYYTGTLPVTGA